jgi:4'-phosphopantetheinyl transferase
VPLFFLKNISPQCAWAIWTMTETYDQLWAVFPRNESDLTHFKEISHPQKQTEFLASRLLIDKMLSHWQSAYYGIQKDALKRPSLVNYGYKISLSHSHEYAAAIIDQNRAVGIDLELIRPQIARIKHKFLSENELAFAQTDLNRLTLLWAGKEALYKLYGQKQLIFKTDMWIPDFEINPLKGQTEIVLFPQTPHNQVFTMNYEKLDNYWLVFVF